MYKISSIFDSSCLFDPIHRIVIICFSVLFFLPVEGKTTSLPERIVYLYDQPLKFDNPDIIYEQIKNGQFVDTIFNGQTNFGKSAWIYIPKSILLKDTALNYVITGFYDYTDLYSYQNGAWQKTAHGGYYMKFSDESDIADRLSFRLFENTGEIADAYLIACRRNNNYSPSVMEAQLVSLFEVENWEHIQNKNLEWFNIVFLFFTGAFFLFIIIFTIRYFITKNLAYLLFSIGSFFVTLNFLIVYFVAPSKIRFYPFDDPLIAVALSDATITLGFGFYIYSFKYFYEGNEYLKQMRIATNVSMIVSLIVAVFFLFFEYYFQLFYLANIVMGAYLMIGIFIIYFLVYQYWGDFKGKPIRSPYVMIAIGSSFIVLAAIIGFSLSIIYQNNTNYISGAYLLSLPIIIGVFIFNLLTLLAFTDQEVRSLRERDTFEMKLYEAEIQVLQNSLNPHFIFNSLNLIDYFLYNQDYKKARNTLFQFSDLLRMVIDKSQSKTIPLRDEIKLLKLYLELEMTRKNNFFTYKIEIDDDLGIDQILVPVLITQPSVENAIRHGVMHLNNKDGRIVISFSRADNFLIVKIQDNGVGYQNSMKSKPGSFFKREHLGMSLTERRLKLFSDLSEYKVETPDDEGTIIWIKIPIY